MTKVLAFSQDRQPRQSALKTLECNLLEKPDVVMNGEPPFGVMIRYARRVAPAPRATHAIADLEESGGHKSKLPCGSVGDFRCAGVVARLSGTSSPWI